MTPQEREDYIYAMSWIDASVNVNKNMLIKIRDQMTAVLDGTVTTSMINYANRKEEILKYTQYSLLVINKTIDLLEAIELRGKAAMEAKDGFINAMMMWNTMNRNDDTN